MKLPISLYFFFWDIEAKKLDPSKKPYYVINFDDAEESEMPKMIKKVSWQEVKDFFIKQTIKLAEKYI